MLCGPNRGMLFHRNRSPLLLYPRRYRESEQDGLGDSGYLRAGGAHVCDSDRYRDTLTPSGEQEEEEEEEGSAGRRRIGGRFWVEGGRGRSEDSAK